MALFFILENIIIPVHTMHTKLRNQRRPARFLLQCGDTDTQIGKLIFILPGELADYRLLLCRQTVALGHQPCHHLCQLITGEMLVSAERSVRISLYDILIRQRTDCLISPGISVHIRKRIGCRNRKSHSCKKRNDSGF